MKDSSSFPLLTRDADDAIANITQDLPLLGGFQGQVRSAEFLLQVNRIAEQLPDYGYVINLCDNRYLFTLLFCAALVRGQTSLLPPNKKELTQTRLNERYGNVYIAHDWSCLDGIAADIPLFKLSDLEPLLNDGGDDNRNNVHYEPPLIPLDHLAAISFTSGSTGDSKPNEKSWRTVVESSKINASHMLAGYRESDSTLHQLATVPPQHMWGLETSVFFPLFESVCVSDAKPLFPQDIADLLKCLPAPRMLVSAPVHLRALCASQLNFPVVNLVLCATSPLSDTLALEVEALLSQSETKMPSSVNVSELREVYGCSEVGSMAIRNTAMQADWQLFTGISLSENDGGATLAATEYLPEPVVLQDRIQVLPSGGFKLAGRDSDMVDMAGKRGSLLELNKMLLSFPGIIDGVIFIPEPQKKLGRAAKRLAAMVVLPDNVGTLELKSYLSKHVDDAFIPRPIIAVSALPREENGKLTAKRLNEHYQAVR
ncbi:MAG: AMP-binding protein [Cellvibrionaceae bacterium]